MKIVKVEHVAKALKSIASDLFRQSDKSVTVQEQHILRTNGGHLRNIADQLKDGFKLDANHVIVTRYEKPNGKILVHAYGPYTRAEAFSQRRKMEIESNESAKPGEGIVQMSVHKMIDIDGENIVHEIRGWRS